jgi:hypothetical protein
MAPYIDINETPDHRGKGLFTLDGRFGRLKLPVRMHVVQYSIGSNTQHGLVIISPFSPTPGIVSWLTGLGKLTYIVAPNKVNR